MAKSSAESAKMNIAKGEYCRNSPFNQISVIGIANMPNFQKYLV